MVNISLLEAPPERRIRLAVETGGTKILARLLADRDNALLAEGRWATGVPTRAAEDISRFVADAMPVDARLLSGGLAAFGPLVIDPASSDYGLMLETSKPGWSGSNLRRMMQDRLGVPIAVDTDVNAAALAEQRLHDPSVATLAYITVGTGIGAGLAINGTTLKGAMHPEFGHVRLSQLPGDDFVSLCPFHVDCAEGLAAGPAIRRRIGEDKALAHAPEVRKLVTRYLGQLAATVVLAWSPGRIVWGGGVLQTAGLVEEIEAAMTEAFGGYGVGSAARSPGFCRAARLEHAGLEGALVLARALVPAADGVWA